MHAFKLQVSYAQIAVFDDQVREPFNDWTDRHVAQGFSWRRGSVSFKTLIDSGNAAVEWSIERRFEPRDGVRVISVPFSFQSKGCIEIASITDGRKTGIRAGDYQLVFETGTSGEICWCRFVFIPGGVSVPRIIKQDAQLSPVHPLLMESSVA